MMERKSGFDLIRRVCGRMVVIGAMSASLAVAASAASAERSLAGIKIFSPMSQVLKKYGTPTEVRVGGQTTDTQGANANGPGGPGMGGPSYPGAGGPGIGGPSYPGAGGPGMGAPGIGAPSYPGAGGPYGGGAGSDDGTSVSPSGQASYGVTLQSNMVTWIYDLNDGGSLEFTFSSDGRVIQIHATGLKGGEHTARGVELGMKLSEVMNKYGFPERQFISNRILNASYINRYHVAFQFYHQKLVGIIIAAVD